MQWLRGSGLTLEDGVLCRPTCHVVGANDIVAAGDVARWPNLRFEATPRRVEHWMNAVDMGRAAAESLLAGAGRPSRSRRCPGSGPSSRACTCRRPECRCSARTPFRWPEQDGNRGITGYVRNGRLIGIIGRDNPRGMLHWTAELKRELRRSETLTNPPMRRSARNSYSSGRETGTNAASSG